MAKHIEMDEANRREFDEWLEQRPDCVKSMVATHPPDVLYRMKSTGKRVTIVAYGEDGTVLVFVSGRFNRVICDRQVCGIPLDDLEECDLPGPDEPLGAVIKDNSVISDIISKASSVIAQGPSRIGENN